MNLVKVFGDTERLYQTELVDAIADSLEHAQIYEGTESTPRFTTTKLTVAKSWSKTGRHVAIVVPTSSKPGGEVRTGGTGTEEEFCRCSTLLPLLEVYREGVRYFPNVVVGRPLVPDRTKTVNVVAAGLAGRGLEKVLSQVVALAAIRNDDMLVVPDLGKRPSTLAKIALKVAKSKVGLVKEIVFVIEDEKRYEKFKRILESEIR